VAKIWYGQRAYFLINPEFTSSFEMHISFANPTFHDGDKLLRILFGWEAQTALTDGAGVPDRGPWPMLVKLAYQPDPGGDLVVFQPNDAGTALLWREAVDWRPRYFTDGSVHSWGWEAHSGQLRSSPAQRDIADHTVAELVAAVGFDAGWPDFPADAGYQPLDVQGYLWVEYLVEQ
jgi:hypothetical protein